MKYIIALLLTFGAFAAQATTPTKRISLDIGRPENTFVLGPISRGSSEYIDCALYVRGTAYPTNDLSGSLWYSVANTSTTGVSISTVDADVINGHVYIQMSVTDSLGLSTTEADYPITYYASVVLTNATQTHVFDVGTLVLRWDAATASAGSATLSNGAQPTYFTALTDTPSSYTGQGGKVVSVNTGGTALEFTTAGSGSGDLTEVQVSGSILTVASGTGPIPIVGLTTAAVQAAQSAETDPVWGAVSNSVTSDIDAIEAKTNTWNNAVQKDGDTMTGNLAFTEGVVVGDIVFKPVIGTTDAAEDVSFGQFSAGGYGIDGPYMVVRKTGHASNPNGIDFVVPSSKAIRYLYGFGTVGAIISNGVVSADEFVGGGVSLTGITSNSIAAATDTAYRSGGTTYTAGTNLDLIGGTDFNLDSSAVASLALADSALQSEVQDIAAVVALDGDIGTGNITSAAGGTTLDMSSGKFYSSGGTVDISGGTGPALSGSAFSASIDATTGNQIVGWSVLTNQIALLAPAGGGATPAFTNAAGNTYSVADLSGAQDGNGIVYSFTLGGWTNSANRVMQNGDSPTALDATAWRTLYSDGDGAITELALGTSGQHLTSNGASSAPTWETPSAGGGSQTPWTNNVDAAGFALTALDYTSMTTNAAAVTGVAGKLVQYVLNDRLYSVYDSVTNYAVLN
jgi:hypothetical protein